MRWSSSDEDKSWSHLPLDAAAARPCGTFMYPSRSDGNSDFANVPQ
jgi:hypothetical protein